MFKTQRILFLFMFLSMRLTLFTQITEQEYVQEIKDLRQLNKRLISKLQEVKEIQDKYLVLKDDYQNLRLRYDLIKDNDQDSFDLKRKLDLANFEIKSLQEELAKQNTSSWKLDKLEKENGLLEKDNARLFQDNKQLIKDNTKLKADNYFLLNKVKDLQKVEKKVEGLEFENDSLNQRIIDLTDKKNDLRNKLKNKNEKIQELKKELKEANDNNTIAGSSIVRDLKRKLRQVINTNKNLKQNVSSLQRKNEDQHDKIIEAKDKMNSLFIDLNMMSKKLEESNGLREKIERQEKLIFNLNNEIDAYRQQLLGMESPSSSSHLLGMAN